MVTLCVNVGGVATAAIVAASLEEGLARHEHDVIYKVLREAVPEFSGEKLRT